MLTQGKTQVIRNDLRKTVTSFIPAFENSRYIGYLSLEQNTTSVYNLLIGFNVAVALLLSFILFRLNILWRPVAVNDPSNEVKSRKESSDKNIDIFSLGTSLDGANIGMLVFDDDKRPLYQNSAMVSFFREKTNERFSSLGDFRSQELELRIQNYLTKDLTSGTIKLYRDNLVYITIWFSGIKVNGENRHIAIARDRTARIKEMNAQEDFLSNLSHELKTPLTVIMGYSETLKDDLKNEPSLTEAVHSHANKIYQQSKRINDLFNDISALRQITAQSEIRFETVMYPELQKTLNETHREILDSLASGSFDCEILHGEIPEKFKGNIQLLKVVFRNLMENALKYGGSPPTLTIFVECAEENLRVEFEDNGQGVSPGEKDKIFIRFYRGNKIRSSIPGSGLGLSISKHICRKMGGDLSYVKSSRSNKEVFAVQVPLKPGKSQLA